MPAVAVVDHADRSGVYCRLRTAELYTVPHAYGLNNRTQPVEVNLPPQSRDGRRTCHTGRRATPVAAAEPVSGAAGAAQTASARSAAGAAVGLRRALCSLASLARRLWPTDGCGHAIQQHRFLSSLSVSHSSSAQHITRQSLGGIVAHVGAHSRLLARCCDRRPLAAGL